MQNKTDKIIIHGLNPIKLDPRDRSHHAVFGSMDAVPIQDFDVAAPLEIKDQLDLDFCSGFGSSEVNEDQIGKPLCPYFQFAMVKQVMGDWKAYGGDLRSAAKALVNFGSLQKSLSPYSYPARDRDFLANFNNWPAELKTAALKNRAGSFFTIDGPEGRDLFDNIRTTLYQHKDEKCTTFVGALWRAAWSEAPNGLIPLVYDTTQGSGHCFKFFGQVTFPGESEPRLKAQLSNGLDFGDKGIFYFPRSVVNVEFAPYGQFLIHPMSQEQSALYASAGINVDDSALVKWWKTFIYKMKKI